MNQKIIESAIKDKCLVEFQCSGHPRTAEPHVLGRIGGAIQFLGYQVSGSSSSGALSLSGVALIWQK